MFICALIVRNAVNDGFCIAIALPCPFPYNHDKCLLDPTRVYLNIPSNAGLLSLLALLILTEDSYASSSQFCRFNCPGSVNQQIDFKSALNFEREGRKHPVLDSPISLISLQSRDGKTW